MAKQSKLKIGSIWLSFYIYAFKWVKGKQKLWTYSISAKCENYLPKLSKKLANVNRNVKYKMSTETEYDDLQNSGTQYLVKNSTKTATQMLKLDEKVYVHLEFDAATHF